MQDQQGAAERRAVALGLYVPVGSTLVHQGARGEVYRTPAGTYVVVRPEHAE